MKKVLVLITLIFVLTGCSSKANNSLSINEFKDIVIDNGYTTEDSKDQFENYDYINNAYIAYDKTDSYQIEYYSMDSAREAIAFYDLNKTTLEAYKTSDSKEYTSNNKYTITTDTTYATITIKDETVILTLNDVKYKDKVNFILKKLGY